MLKTGETGCEVYGNLYYICTFSVSLEFFKIKQIFMYVHVERLYAHMEKVTCAILQQNLFFNHFKVLNLFFSTCIQYCEF